MKPFLFAAGVILGAMPASASVLVVNAGWTYDEILKRSEPSVGSVWTLTLTSPGIFSLTDAFLPGDTFFISGDINGVTTLFAGANDFRASGDPIAVAGWLSPSYGKFTTVLGPGTYSFTITGDGVSGFPAGVFLRADTPAAIPEPGTWAMLIVGFGLVGRVLRRRAVAAAA